MPFSLIGRLRGRGVSQIVDHLNLVCRLMSVVPAVSRDQRNTHFSRHVGLQCSKQTQSPLRMDICDYIMSMSCVIDLDLRGETFRSVCFRRKVIYSGLVKRKGGYILVILTTRSVFLQWYTGRVYSWVTNDYGQP